MFPHQKGEIYQLRWSEARNLSTTEDIPPSSFVRLIDGFFLEEDENGSERLAYYVNKPNGDPAAHGISYPTTIQAGKCGGICLDSMPMIVTVDEDPTGWEVGVTTVGPKADSWVGEKDGEGYLFLGIVRTSDPYRVLVQRFSGGGSCDCPENWFMLIAPTRNTGGEFQATIEHAHLDESEQTVTDEYVITLPYNANDEELIAEVQSVGPWASDPDNYDVFASGGRLNLSGGGASISVRFKIPAGESLKFYVSDATELSGVIPYVYIEPMTAGVAP